MAVLRYRARIEAEPGGLLLGGVREHTSLGYQTSEKAAKLAFIFAENNLQAGRKVAHASVQRRDGHRWVHFGDVDLPGATK